jgi:type IV pilus assembly protein PilA
MYKKLQDLKKSKKGFTLVELIVVLVILAILAAILVPTLLGYITKAREEKNYSMAQTIRVAAQSTYTENEGKSGTAGDVIMTTEESTAASATSNPTALTGKAKEVMDLAGASPKNVTAFSFKFDATGKLTENPTVNIDGSKYTYDKDKNSWSAAKITT